MSDVSTRMTLHDDISAKMQKIANSARTVVAQFNNIGSAMDNAFRSSTATSFASQAGSAFNSVEDDVDALGRAIDEAVSGLESFSAADTRGIESAFSEAADSADDLSESATRASESVDVLANAAGDLGDGSDGIDSLAGQVDDAGNSMEEASSKAINLSGALKTLFAVVSAAAIIGQVKDFAANSVELGKSYTSVMSEVEAISGASASDLAVMENAARQYGATTVFSATEAAEALKYMSLAGWDAQQSTSALGGVLNLAAASGMRLGEASDMVTDYLSAFGMQADQSTYFADMLAYAQSNSNTTAAQLGEAYKNAAANMHAAGQDVETTTSLLEAMANQGRKGSEAGTSLAAVMRDVTAKMDDGAIKIGDTSIAVQDAYGNFRDMTDILTEVGEATDGMGSAQRAAALSTVFTDDSIKAVNMILAEGMDKVAGYEEALRSASGAAEDMAQTMNDNLSGDLANMNSAYEEMSLQVFEAMEEPLREGTQWVTNDIIPTLTSWVPDAFGTLAGGISKVGNALSPLLKTVLQNPKAIGNAFTSIGAGFAAMKTVNTGLSIAKNVADAGGMINALGEFGTKLFGSPWAAGAATAVAAITAVTFAVEKYNDLQVEKNLSEHFGNVSLNTDEIEGLAGKVIPVDITADLQLANVAFDEADQLVSEAEDLLAQNDAITWRVLNVKGTLPEGDASTLLTNTEEFVSSITTALEKEEYAATLSVKAILGENSTSEVIVDQMRTWFAEDSAAAESLGSAVTDMLQSAIDEGTYNVDTATAISIMEGKMLDLVNGAKNAELQGKLKFLDATSNGAALDPESWGTFVDKVGEYQKDLANAEAENYEKLFGQLEQLAYNDEDRRGTVDEIEKILTSAYQDLDISSTLSGWSAMFNSLGHAYREELSNSSKSMEQSTSEWVHNLQDGLLRVVNGEGWDNVFNNLINTEANVSSGLDKTTRDAIAERFSHMMPTVEEIQSSIDSYFDENSKQISAIPEQLMKSYYDAMEVGAAGGDEGATAALVAKQIASTFGDKSTFENALSEAGLTTDYLSNFFGGTLMEEINRAFAETTDQVDYSAMLDGIVKSLAGQEPDWAAVEALLNKYGYSISGALKEQGIDLEGEIPVNASGVSVDTDSLSRKLEGLNYVGTTTIDGGEVAFQYTVNKGETLSGIMQQYGLVWEEVKEQIQAANPDIDDVNLIYPNQIINIPEAVVEAASVDASQVGEAAKEAAENETGKVIEEEQQVKNTLKDGGVETSEIGSAAETAAKTETEKNIETEQTVNTTLVDGETDASQVGKSAKDVAESKTAEAIEAEQPVETVLTDAGTDDSQLEQAKSEKEITAEPTEQNVPTTIKFEVASLDDSELASAISDKLKQGEAVPVEVPADVIINAGVVDAYPARETAQKNVFDVFSTSFSANGMVDVALRKGNDNIDAVYSYVGGLVSSAWMEPYSASGTVNVTLTANYSLANPTKTISFGGGANGSATVTAALHADGGIFSQPHFGIVAEAGPESIIPLDGSEDSIDLWQETGKRLGALNDGPIQITPSIYSEGKNSNIVEEKEVRTSSNRSIDININGNGKIVAGNGVSKEDIVQVLMEKAREVFVNIVAEEALVGGDASYEF